MKIEPRDGWTFVDDEYSNPHLTKDEFCVGIRYGGEVSLSDDDGLNLRFWSQDDACEVAELILSKWNR